MSDEQTNGEGVLKISLVRKTLPVLVTDENGGEKEYTLRELTGKERNKYLNQMTNRVKMGPNGKPAGIKTFDGFQSDLLCRSLVDDEGRKASKEFIEEMPALAQHELFEKAQEISGLDKEDVEDDEGND